MKNIIGFIGCGNMGGAIARALSKKTTDFMITDRSGRGRELAQELGCTYGDAETICRQAAAVFLAVKPQMLRAALAPLAEILSARKPLIISMVAGVTMEAIQDMIGSSLPVLRIMPNTPVAVGSGVVPYCCSDLVTEDQEKLLLSHLSRAGFLTPMDESLLDAASALSGCGPAFVYMFIEALADGAVACGLSRTQALQFAAATVIGSGEMVLASGSHPGILKDAVCSPAGSTIQGVRVLEEHGFRGAVMDCVIAAFEKNKKLGS